MTLLTALGITLLFAGFGFGTHKIVEARTRDLAIKNLVSKKEEKEKTDNETSEN